MFGTFKAQKKLQELEERFEKLQRDFHALELEWENSYDKLRTMMGRVAKRAEALHDEAEKRAELFPRAENDEAPRTVGTGLTAHQRQVQQEVLRRRGGMRTNGEER